MGPRSAVEIRSLSSLDQVDEARWDGLSGAASFYLSHDWLAWVEQQPGAEPAYLLAYGNGRLLAALPTYALPQDDQPGYQTQDLLDGRIAGRYLLAGPRFGGFNDLLLAKVETGELEREALEALLAAAEERARTLGLDGVVFLHLCTAAARRLRELRPDLSPLSFGLDTELDLPGRAFDDYLAHVDKRRAHGIRKERRAFAAANYEVAIEPFEDCWYEMGPLLANVQHKYGQGGSVADYRSNLQGALDRLGRHAVVFTARRQGRLVAASLYYRWRDTLYGRLVGFDYDALVDAAEYFNIYFYEPIDYAYRHGYDAVHLGRESNYAKLRRGAHPRAQWALCIDSGQTRGTSPDWRDFNRAAVAHSRAEFRYADIDVPAAWL